MLCLCGLQPAQLCEGVHPGTGDELMPHGCGMHTIRQPISGRALGLELLKALLKGDKHRVMLFGYALGSRGP